MVFKEKVFEPVNVEMLYKAQMNGLSDVTLPEFNPIASSSCYKKEYKADGAQKEFIQSYLESAKVLSERLEELKRPHMKMFFHYSLTLPTIYLCRHCIELSIKYAIYQLGEKPDDKHGLDKIWSSFLSRLPKERSGKDRSLISDMGKFIRNIDSLDNTGTKLRYPLETDGATYTQGEFLWANTKLIVSETEKFVKQLEQLDIENIKKVKSS